MSKNLKEMKKELLETWKDYDKQGTITWNWAAQDLQYQMGSLTKRILQMKGYRYDDGLSKEEIMESLSDELVDIIAEVIFIAHGLNIDLDTAWNAMITSDKKKIEERS